jgi:hypothetical protein
MYQGTSLKFSRELQQRLRDRNFRQGNLGFHAARRFVQELTGRAFLPIDVRPGYYGHYGPTLRQFFLISDQSTWLYHGLEHASRIPFYMRVDNRAITLQGSFFKSGDKKPFATIATVFDVDGEGLYVEWAKGTRRLGAITIGHCIYCGVEMPLPSTEKVPHHDACVLGIDSYLPRRTDWDQGFDDGEDGRGQRSHGQEYLLGYNMGSKQWHLRRSLGLI